MPGEIGILRFALSDAAVLAESSQAASQEVENLLLDQPTDSWQTTGVAAESIVGDLGAVAPVDCAALLAGNFRSDTTIRFRGADTEANLTAAPAVDTTVAAAWAAGDPEDYAVGTRNWIKVLSATFNIRWFRFDLADSGHPDGYFRFGRLGVGALTRTKDMLPSALPVHQEPEDRVRTSGGGIHFRAVGGRPVLGPLTYLRTEAQLAELRRLIRLNGSSRPVLYVCDVEREGDEMQEDSIYGLLGEVSSLPIPHRGLRELRLQVQGL